MNEHQLYVKMYPEMLARSQSVGAFVKKVWELVGGGKQLGIAYDHVIHLFLPQPIEGLITRAIHSSSLNLSAS
jgi:hypothetical protein